MGKKSGFIHEFKEFIARGNVMDMAIGVIIGGAFKTIIDSLVKDVIMPVITLITGGIDFTNWFISLNGETYSSLADATEAGAATLNYGVFITAVINFLIMAFVIFCVVKGMNKLAALKDRKKEETVTEPTTKKCPYCKSNIDIEATKCPHCTSDLKD